MVGHLHIHTYITLHCIALHYITLHCITLHYITYILYIYIYIYYGTYCENMFLVRRDQQIFLEQKNVITCHMLRKGLRKRV